LTDQNAESAPSQLRHKFTLPGLPPGSIDRPRLDRLLGELFDTYSVVEIVAAPGSGKTVQAQLFGSGCGRRLAWLTMDRSDVTASGLVFDLAAALGPLAGNAVSTMRQALQTTGTVEEAAAILANSADLADALLVIDECQEIAASAEAASALDLFLEYVPERLRVLLLAREELPWPLQKRYIHGQIAQIGDAVLNLTFEETAECVRQLGANPEIAERVFSSTGGWAAGVAFASRFGVGEEPNFRDLSSYFGHRVLAGLPEDEQRFLLDTSVTGAVTRDVAVALCGLEGQRLWSAVSARHLPATSTTSSAIVIHSLFRSFLQQQLVETEPARRAQLLASYARYLAATRQYRDATDVWISLGELDQAHETAVQALPSLFADADWPVIMRWLDAFGESRLYADPRLIGAYVYAVYGLREFDRARTLVRKLDREGRLRAVIALDPTLLATAAWAMQARPQEALRLLDKYQGDTRAHVVRYMIEVTIATRPVPPPDGYDLPDVERLLSWGLFLQGRLGELARLRPADDTTAVLNPNVVLASAFLESSEAAAELWQRVPPEIRDRPHSQFIAAMMALFSGDNARAWRLLEQAVADSQRSGFPLEPVYEIFQSYLLLIDNELDKAITLLEALLEEMSRTAQSAYAEMAQCFVGLAYLRTDRVPQARLLVGEAVASMSQSQRRLLLPLAAVGLSEAEARLGNAEAASKAAELAYHMSMLTGTSSILVQAVRLFPDVQRRQLARFPADSRWRRIVVTPSVRRHSSAVAEPRTAQSTLLLQPFGRDRDLIVNGDPVKVGRMKILEFVACLSLHLRGIDRFELQRRLFPEADQRNGGNHFRQIIHKMRHATSVNIERNGNLILLPSSLDFQANDIESERILDSASAFFGPERQARLEAGLALTCGPYLEGSSLAWVEERRNHLDLVYEEARLELARLYLDLGEPDAARALCETVLATNTYSDPSYRILVEIERKVGSESSVLATYRRATEALTELGLQPGDARRLLQRGMPSIKGVPARR
jgi:ATP/maltotriose-dependent transcriptional regulator MalT/DNA-binding SARP family transcriptional activator